MKKWKRKTSAIMKITCAFLILISCFGIINLFTATTTLSNIEEAWDGVEVATSFSGGNGTKENPYQISSGSELAYLKQIVEQNQIPNLQEKYFVLMKDIDLGGNNWQGIGTKNEDIELPFSGHFDGAGYSIKNFKIETPTTIDNVDYYGLFNLVSNAEIKNLNLNNVTVTTTSSTNLVTLGLIAGKVTGTTSITNIATQDTVLDLSKTLGTKENKIGGLFAEIEEKVTVENIYNNMEIKDTNANSYGKVFGILKGQANNIVTKVTYSNFLSVNIPVAKEIKEPGKLENDYELTSDNKLYISSNENITLEELLDNLNKKIETDYRWVISDVNLKISRLEDLKVTKEEQKKDVPALFNFGRSAAIPLHDTEMTDTTVYINDLDSDYNYYKGLNYTSSETGTLPTGNNQGIYTDNNLVKAYIKYSGEDINNSDLVGHVSLEEQQSELIYYKYYPVEAVTENGQTKYYATIELIDNPFADHPNNKGFNGWVTDDPNTEIIYDADTYTRYARVEVTYTNGIPDTINVTFHSYWIEATVYEMTRSNDWTNAFAALKNVGMEPIKSTHEVYEDMSNYYIRGTISRREYFPTGAVNDYGNNIGGNRCGSTRCTYYTKSSSNYDPDSDYYRFTGSSMVSYTPKPIGQETETIVPEGSVASGLYRPVTINRYQSVAGYYDETGQYQESGTCNSSRGCTYYELEQYYDASGNVNVVTEDSDLYYLVTRDTNIIVLETTCDETWNGTKPFTLTGIYNGQDFSDNELNIEAERDWFGNLDGGTYIRAYADTRIEYLTITTGQEKEANGTPPSNGTRAETIYGYWHNLKIGRGVKPGNGNNYTTANTILAGGNNSVGSEGNIERYKMIVESGVYNLASATNGTSSSTLRIDGQVVYGSDYDRVAKNNDNLEIYFCASGSWGGYIYSNSTQTGVAIHTNVKSGSFGTSEYDYSTGIYIGGRQGGTHYAARDAIIEGGDIYNLIGGPLTASNRTNINDTYINIKGGTIDMVIGGAGASETYGNRIVNMTGGTVNYGVFGGSNGYTGGDNDSNYKGTLSGSTFIYVGGNATVGNDNLINNNRQIFGVSSGNVFGIGNGNSDSTQVGSADNSNIVIDGNAVIKQSVYGGGNYGATGLVPYQDRNGSKESTTNIKILGGTIEGSVYGGGNNNGSGGEATYTTSWWGGGTTYTTTVTSTININVSGGNIKKSVYGGSRVRGTVYGDSNVNILGGTITEDVYGGGEGGYSNRNTPGTYIKDNVFVTIGTAENGPTIEGTVYGGSAYGTVNGTSENESANNNETKVTINNGVITNSVFGGGKGSTQYTPKVYGNVTVTVNNGNIGSVYGGNDAAGSPSNNDVVYLNGGVIGNAFGGGNQTGQTTTNIYLQGATITNKLFGGSNQSGTVNTSNVYMSSGNAGYVYGGNNIGGTTTTTNVTITGGTVTGDVYGGGSKASTTDTHLYLGNATLNNVYGGGEEASADTTESTIEGATITNFFGGSNVNGTVDTTTTTMTNGNVGNLHGGNNEGGTTNTANITIQNGEVDTIYGGGNQASSTFSDIKINNGKINNIYGGGNEAGLNTSNITINLGTIGNIYGGSNKSGNITKSNIKVGQKLESDSNITIDNIYGGNNMGGLTNSTNLDIDGGVIGNIYGGGNAAEVAEPIVDVENATVNNIFGGGNMAKISGDTKVTIKNSTINTNIYGGGNEGSVDGSTEVLLTSSTVLGSAYAGGNGSTAIVNRNTTITVEGDTVIGSTSSKAPHSGCLFGSGNAAATGTKAENNSLATVNVVGARIYGNVYGGANTSVVYGKTDTNIGTNAVANDTLIETSINIGGTVFGGGEANASGDEDYDYSFISVTGAIDIAIDGKGYLNNNHDFIISGSIFGSGNASSSSGTSNIYIANLGTREKPSENISIQRANSVILDNTVMELEGTTDRTNEYSDIEYSLNRIDELNIKNNTMLLLQRNANLLQSFKSTVDIDGEEVQATVEIDDDTKTVTKNVDNRLYMLANRNLNITTNESATAYGEVSGMTFFGMYNKYGNGSFSYGLYDDSVNYGDSGDAGDIIIGGSYVLGLHKLNHDITVDGFYSNYIDDAYTEITTKYIEPTPPDSNYYMWTIGISAINYSFTMTASKYSSLGTYELSMRDFASGDTTFEVIGFNSEGLTSGVGLVDSNNVPKLADTQEEANSILGLSMKSETSEWTAYRTTKFLSNNNGTYTGDKTYKTDSQALAPSMMFYLYHAKNISLDQELGTVVITMQAKTPINDIEFDVQLITITIDLTARNYDDGNAYDASITYDKKYEMPAATNVNITNQSQFTAYFDLFAQDSFENIYGRENENYHALVTDYALPVGTQITMLDYSSQDGKPKYYYFTVDEEEYNRATIQLESENEITYRLNKFIKMGSTSEDNTYDDKTANNEYYEEGKNRTIEEFIFIFDFKETNTTGDHLNKYMRFELRNEEDRAIISVLGIRQNLMYYNLYESSNMVLNQEISLDNTYVYPGTTREINYATAITYDQTSNRESIINTNYESTNMGLNVTLFDSSGNQVSSSLLTGTSIRMDGEEYFADSEGVFRIKLAGKVSNLNKSLYLLTDSTLPAGNYRMIFTLFASSDGLHNSGGLQYVEEEKNITVVPADNAIKATTLKDETKVVNGETRQNELETSESSYRITTTQSLTNPNLRIALYKRNTDNKDTTAYTEVNLDNLFINSYSQPSDYGLTSGSTYEKLISNSVTSQTNITLEYATTLTSGTYRVVFRLYDKDQLIDEDWEYVIVKKKEE